MLPKPLHFIFNHFTALIQFRLVLDIWIILVRPKKVSESLKLFDFLLHFLLVLLLLVLRGSILELQL